MARRHRSSARCAVLCRHLPADVRVFSVQRVSNSYNARAMCVSRAYEYHVPAAVLGLRGAASGAGEAGAADREHDEEVMRRLRAALTCLTGERPFHNYTKRCGAACWENGMRGSVYDALGPLPYPARAAGSAANSCAGNSCGLKTAPHSRARTRVAPSC